jgi:hypothetical protein
LGNKFGKGDFKPQKAQNGNWQSFGVNVMLAADIVAPDHFFASFLAKV